MPASSPLSQHSQHPSRRVGTLARILTGIARRCAFTGTKARGTRTPGTATTEGCSFSPRHGSRLAEWYDLILLPPGSSCIERGSSIDVTVRAGGSATAASGEIPPERVA